MKLHLSVLEKLIDLPTNDPNELRHVLDDLGLEVKDIDQTTGRAIYNIETLANRGDHLYALGIARELAARNLSNIRYPQIAEDFSSLKPTIPVRITTDKCSKYALLEVALPAGMKLRPDVAAVMGASDDKRHAIVDILNYVLLELGQPMHAFDRDKIEGEIIVALTTSPEEVEALDGKIYRVPENTIVIRDRKKTVAVAGIIGCANSMVSPSTTRVLLESACFDPVSVRKSARAVALSTDASYAFERGADREAIVPALRRVVALAEGSVKGSESASVIGFTSVESSLLEKRKVTFRFSAVKAQLNSPRLNEVEITSRLKSLGFTIDSSEGGKCTVGVPSWRLWDVRNEDDIIEDFARSHGLSRIKLDLPPLSYEQAEIPALERCMRRIEPALTGQGFCEVITRSFTSAADIEILAALDPSIADKHMALKNSVEGSYSHLRVSNILHLSRLAAESVKRGAASVKIYECARSFSAIPLEDRPYQYERDVLSIAQAGRWFEHEWRKPEEIKQRVFLFKGALENLLEALGERLEIGESKERLLHPGMQASIKAGRGVVGFFGVVHPRICEVLELKQQIVYSEFDLDKLIKLSAERGELVLSEFPAIRRDITLKVPVRELASRVIRFIHETKLSDLKEISVVDDFKKPEESFRRLSLRLTFQSAQRTLQSEEVEKAMGDLLTQLRDKHQLELAT